jgi:hypothetical protein
LKTAAKINFPRKIPMEEQLKRKQNGMSSDINRSFIKGKSKELYQFWESFRNRSY